MTNIISLTPNFSWVSGVAVRQNRFDRGHTRLKPGANEIEAAVANRK